MADRFNRTLLNTLEEKVDWESHVSTMTHAYNAVMHNITGFSSFFLCLGVSLAWL